LHWQSCRHALLLLLQGLYCLQAMLLRKCLHLVRLQPLQLHAVLREALHCCHCCLDTARNVL
jgi:hypothetical protein